MYSVGEGNWAFQRSSDWRLTFLWTRGSKCTNHRKTISIACFLRGHLNVVNPMRDDLDFV